jgi:hypothetical protein
VKYIFIDESGDLGTGQKSSNYLVLVALAISNEKNLHKIVRNLKKKDKQLRKIGEIKFTNLSNQTKKNLLKSLNKLDVQVKVIILNKRNTKLKLNNQNELYNLVAGYLAEKIKYNEEIELWIDKTKNKKKLESDFNIYFKKIISSKYKINITHHSSYDKIGLQFADLVAGSCFQKYERGNDSYVKIIESKMEIIHI